MAPRKKEPSDESTTSTKGSGTSQSTAPTEIDDRDTGKPSILPRLSRPSPLEAKYYYQGLPSLPRLVGRTTAGVVPWKGVPNFGLEWAHPDFDLDPAVTLATPIGGPHRALREIEGLLPSLKEAIHALPWTCLDLLRLGSSKVSMTERPVVLWVGVQSDRHVPWETVAQALRGVRRVLDSAGLTDVECEVREADVAPLGPWPFPVPVPAVSPDPVTAPFPDPVPVWAPSVDETFPDEWEVKRHLTTALGQAIVPAAQQLADTGGTLCLYVCTPSGDRASAPIFALTCRHVCLPLAHHSNQQYRQTNHLRRHAVYMPSSKVVREAIARAKDGQEETMQKVQALEAKVRNNAGDRDAQDLLRIHKTRTIPSIEATLQTLHTLLPAPARDIGSVVCSPPLEVVVGPDGKPWTRDWGLVQLKAAKYPRQSTKNVVSLQETPSWVRDKRGHMDYLARNCQLPAGFTLPSDGLLPIKEVVSLAELNWICSGRADRPAPPWLQKEDDTMAPADVQRVREEAALRKAPAMLDREQCRVLVVGKRGKTTGLTWGAVNEFQSVLRTPHETMEPFESRELAILGTLNDRNTSFSQPGDSGSLVFDITGRAVAMVTAGTPPGRRVFDVSYATPIELVLEDMTKQMGRPVWPL